MRRCLSVLRFLARLLLGLPSPDTQSPALLNLGLFDRVPLLKRFASRLFFRRFRLLLPQGDRPVHALCVGRSGSGKSEVLKLLALAEKTTHPWLGRQRLRRDRALIVVDPHGELARQLAQQPVFAQDLGLRPDDPNLILLDPCLATREGRSPVLNPFDLYGHQHSAVQREKAVEQLTAVLRTLTCKRDESLSTNMETLLYPCLSVLLARPNSTLFDLLRFLQTSRNDDLLRLGRSTPSAAHRLFFQHAFGAPRFVPTRGALATKIQSLLNSRVFAAFLAEPHSTLNLERAIAQGKSIILSCAAGQIGPHTMTAIGRFMIGMVLAVAFNRPSQERFRRPIRLIIDEMQHFVSDELEVILTEARKYGLHLTLACQMVGQGTSTQLSRVILGNTALKLLGDAGADSRRVMAREMGIGFEATRSLSVGQFLLRHQHDLPVCIRFTSAHVHQRVSPSQWHLLKHDQIRRYYRPASTSDPPEAAPEEPVAPNTLSDFVL